MGSITIANGKHYHCKREALPLLMVAGLTAAFQPKTATIRCFFILFCRKKQKI
jgi:hypothetical protein